jgi:hypothetical protein
MRASSRKRDQEFVYSIGCVGGHWSSAAISAAASMKSASCEQVEESLRFSVDPMQVFEDQQ